MTAKLRRGGRRINRKKERDIRGSTRSKHRSLTNAYTKAAPSPDLVRRDFAAAEPGPKLALDIGYSPTLDGWWCLATVIQEAGAS